MLDNVPERPAPSYALIYPLLCEVAKPLGYALALHGSMNRDLDIVAIPLVDDAVEPEILVEALKERIDVFTGWDDKPGKHKPHGRRGWLIWFKGVDHPIGGGACIDLSIMPKQENNQ